MWASRYDGRAGSNDYAKAVACDSRGDIYVSGYSATAAGTFDFLTIKYAGSGGVYWIKGWDGLAGADDIVSALATDRTDGVYVTGWSTEAGGLSHFATVAYGPGGNLRWTARYAGPKNLDDRPFAIGVDDSGNVFVAGRNGGKGVEANYATVKYDRNGLALWSREYDGPVGSTDGASALAVDRTGAVCVTGMSIGATGPDFATIKYKPACTVDWIARYPGGWAQAIASDPGGNFYVTGPSAGYDIVTIRYTAHGVRSWVRTYDGPDRLDDWPCAIAIDRYGAVSVTGTSIGAATGADYVLIRYDSLGNELWTKRYATEEDDKPSGLATDSAGNVIVAGTSGNNYTAVFYDPTGTELRVETYNGPGDSTDLASAIAIDRSGAVYVTGSSFAPITHLDYCTVKYAPMPAGISDHQRETQPAAFCRRAGDKLELTFSLDRAGPVIIGLFDPAGRKARPTRVRALDRGVHRLSYPLPGGPGVFFLRLESASPSALLFKIVVL